MGTPPELEMDQIAVMEADDAIARRPVTALGATNGTVVVTGTVVEGEGLLGMVVVGEGPLGTVVVGRVVVGGCGTSTFEKIILFGD